MRLTIDVMDVSGGTAKYTSITDALKAAEVDQRLSEISFRTATGERVQLQRPSHRHPFELKYIDDSDARPDEGFEVQTRDGRGQQHYWPMVSAAVGRARRDRLIWKISFTGPSGERVRLVRDQFGLPFVLDMMEIPVERTFRMRRAR